MVVNKGIKILDKLFSMFYCLLYTKNKKVKINDSVY